MEIIYYREEVNDQREVIGQNGDGCYRLVAPTSDKQFEIYPKPTGGQWADYNDTNKGE